jgi:NAD(P)-dependent dehydrogenase (short-subunit alcohol dehydrogenase family)
MSLQGKVALVTGGGRGIGRVIAQRLAKDGARVVVTGRSRAELEALAAVIGGVAVVADVSDRAALDAALAEVAARVERVDVLVNNAGVADSAPLQRTSDEMWDRILEINATAPFRISRAFVPQMVKRGWGRVINIASNAGVSGYAYTAAYCASKHALVGLTRALAVDLAPTGVTVNAVCPGWVETQMATDAMDRIARATKKSAEEAREALAGMSPQKRLISPEEVAHVVAMLCDEGSRGINGQTIIIDGGQILK